MDGLVPIEFDVRPAGTPRLIERHVRHALRRRLPEVWPGPPRTATLTLVGSGPSALHAPLDRPYTMAVNGALDLFTRQGLAPTYWAASDPQKAVVQFLRAPPRATTYLLASKLHPAVFRRLARHRVLVWHLEGNAPFGSPAIPMASTITLNALELARMMGFRRIETWGWDGCMMDGLDHALPQRHQGETKVIHVQRRDGGMDTFTSTPTWGLEADDAVCQLSRADYAVSVRGGGMIGSILAARLPAPAA